MYYYRVSHKCQNCLDLSRMPILFCTLYYAIRIMEQYKLDYKNIIAHIYVTLFSKVRIHRHTMNCEHLLFANILYCHFKNFKNIFKKFKVWELFTYKWNSIQKVHTKPLQIGQDSFVPYFENKIRSASRSQWFKSGKVSKMVPGFRTYISLKYYPWVVQNQFWWNPENSSQWDNCQKPFFGGDFT